MPVSLNIELEKYKIRPHFVNIWREKHGSPPSLIVPFKQNYHPTVYDSAPESFVARLSIPEWGGETKRYFMAVLVAGKVTQGVWEQGRNLLPYSDFVCGSV